MTFTILEYDQLPSTNDTAKALAREGAVNGTIVLAREQSFGRGQYGRVFLSPQGGLYLSLILRPALEPARLVDLTALVGVVCCRAVIKACPLLDARIKPVNDIRLNRRKVGGILVEMTSTGYHTDFVVIGIGVNVESAPDVPDQKVISLTQAAAEKNAKIDFGCFRDTLLEQLCLLTELLESRSQGLDDNPAETEWADEYTKYLEEVLS